MHKLSLFIFIILLAGCTGNYGKVFISTSSPASCRAKNQEGSWQVNAPNSITVKKSPTDLRIFCASKQARLAGSRRIKPDRAGNYPPEVVIKLVKKQNNQRGKEDEDDMDSDLTPLNQLLEGPPEPSKEE